MSKKRLIICSELEGESYHHTLNYLKQEEVITDAHPEDEILKKSLESTVDIVFFDQSFKEKQNENKKKPILNKLLEQIGHKKPIIVISNSNNVDTYREILNYGASGFIHKSQYDPEKFENQIKTILYNFKKWKPQNISYKDGFYQEIYSRLPHNIERFIEFRRKYPSQPILIYGLKGIGKHFWLIHIFQEFYPNTTLKILDLNKFSQEDLTFNNWFDRPDIIETIHSHTNTSILDQWVITGINEVNLQQHQFNSLIDKHPGIIFLASDNLNTLIKSGSLNPPFRGQLMANSFELTPFYKLGGEEIEHLINYLLSMPSVCPLHSPFLGKLASVIFSPKVLDLLKGHQWDSHLRGLRETIQFIIYQADRRINNINTLIGEDCLPAGIKLSQSNTSISHLWDKPKDDAQKYIENIENNIKQHGHIGLDNEDYLEISKKLKEYHIEYPDLFNKTESERVCKQFKLETGYLESINTLIIHHTNSADYFDEFTKQLKTLIRNYPILLNHNHDILPGSITDEAIKAYTQKANIIFVMFCSDLIAWDDWHHKIFPNISNNKKSKIIVPVIAKPCSWKDYYEGITEIPQGYKSLHDAKENLDDVLTTAMEDKIKPMLNNFKKKS